MLLVIKSTLLTRMSRGMQASLVLCAVVALRWSSMPGLLCLYENITGTESVSQIKLLMTLILSSSSKQSTVTPLDY